MTNHFLALEAIEIFAIKEKDITSLTLGTYTGNGKHFSAHIHLEKASALALQAKDLGWKSLPNFPEVLMAEVTLHHLDGVKVECCIYVK